ncbi:MAG: LemA family protein [Halanaerobiales bacterium]
MFILILLISLAFVIVYAVVVYNKIIRLDNRIENAWSQIDVQLKRRHDLIPNLVETVKGYMKHEKETLESVIKARSQAVDASNIQELAQAEGELNNALSKLLAVVEDYPELKANKNFLELKEELISTENRVAYARQSYNDSVLYYNNRIEVFPSNIIAGLFGFRERNYFETDNPDNRDAVNITF